MSDTAQRIIVTDRRGQEVSWSEQYAADEDRERDFARRASLTKRDSIVSYGTGTRVYNPDDLIGKKGIGVIDEMLRDEQIGPILEERKDDVVTAGIQVLPTGETPQEEDIADFLRWTMEDMHGSLARMLRELATADEYGMSASEITWKRITEGKWGGKIGIDAVRTRKPHNIEFEQDDAGAVTGIFQKVGTEPDGIPFPYPERTIHLVMRSRWSDPWGTTSLRRAYRPYWIKNIALRLWPMALERFGQPWRRGKYPPGTPTAEQTLLESRLAALQASSTIVHPDDMEVELLEVARSISNDHKLIVEWCDKAIAKAAQYPELGGLGERGDVGSRALGETQTRGLQPPAYLLAIELEESGLREQLFRPIVRMNWGVDALLPRAHIGALTMDETVENAAEYRQGKRDLGFRPTPEQLNHYFRSIGFPEMSDDEVIQEEERKDLEQGGEQGEDQGKDANAEAQGGKGAKKGDEDEEFAAQPGWLRRLGYEQTRAELEKRENAAGVAIAEQVQACFDKLVRTIESRTLTQKQDTQGVLGLELPYKGKLNSAIFDMMEGGYVFGRQDTARMLSAVSAEFAAPDIAAVAPLPPEKALAWFRARAFWMTGIQADDMLTYVKGALLQAMKEGERWQDTRRKLQAWFVDQYNAGEIIDEGVLSKGRVETIVRTNLTEAHAKGRLDELRTAAEKSPDFVKGARFVAIRDSQTTEQCRHLHGKVFALDDPDLDAMTPALHFKCRSDLVPFLADEDDEYVSDTEKGIAKDLTPPGFGGNEKKLSAKERRVLVNAKAPRGKGAEKGKTT